MNPNIFPSASNELSLTHERSNSNAKDRPYSQLTLTLWGANSLPSIEFPRVFILVSPEEVFNQPFKLNDGFCRKNRGPILIENGKR